MSRITYMHEEHPRLSAEDKAVLRLLVEGHGSGDVLAALDEDRVGVTHMETSDGRTAASKSEFTTKWGSGGKPLGARAKEFGIGFVKSAPSIALTMAVCWPAGVVQMLGAWHEKFEQRMNSSLLNQKTWLDWIASTHDGGAGTKGVGKDASSAFAVQPLDTSTGHSKEGSEHVQRALARDSSALKVMRMRMSPYFIELDNGEVMKVYALDEDEAKKQASVIVSNTKSKYKTMNDLFEEGAHTYRVVLSDGSITYLTAETKEKAVSISNDIASELKKFYVSVGVETPALGRVKAVTDEGIIPIPFPKSIIQVVKGIAPDPGSVKKLKAEEPKDFYTNEPAKVCTYKLRIGYNSVLLCAGSDEEATRIAAKVCKEVAEYNENIISFLTGSAEKRAWLVAMQDGDQYLICETQGGDDVKTKSLKMMDDKFKLMMKFGKPNVQSFLKTKMTSDETKPAVGVAWAKEVERPKKFKNLNSITLSKVEGGTEKEIYRSAVANAESKEERKELVDDKM